MALFDLESDGLHYDVTKIHCVVHTSNGKDFTELTHYDDMREFFTSAKYLIGHDIIRYDTRVAQKILGIEIKAKLYDTLPLSWYLNHDRLKHGLEGFGEDFGIPKPKIDNWKDLTTEQYLHRCREDVKINWRLWEDLTKRLKFLYKDKQEADRFMQYLSFKMKCAAYQEERGWKLDIDLAKRCVAELTQQQEEKTVELAKAMPKRKLFKKVSQPKVLFKKDGTTSSHGDRWFATLDSLGLDRTHTDDVKVPNGEEEANPGSSDQVKDWLFSLGWKPCTYKYEKEDDGSERTIPQVRKEGELTESVKLLIDVDPAVAVLDGLTVIQHRLSIFQGFLDCQVDGRVRAQIAGLTNTLRFKHAKPLVNLPGVDKPWGKEIRGCLIAEPDGFVCGSDMTSLEDTTRRHYVKPLDPEYVARQSEPGYDPHLDLAVKAGMCTDQEYEFYKKAKELGEDKLTDKERSLLKKITAIRKKAKVVTYSATYGVGKVKLSRSTGMPEEDAERLLKAFWEINWAIKAVAESSQIRKIGGAMWLYNPVSRFWINLRYERDTFSSLNQSTGVFCFDSWLAQMWQQGIKGVFQAHDEVVVLTENQETTEQVMRKAISSVNDTLKLNVSLGVDVQFGKAYSNVH